MIPLKDNIPTNSFPTLTVLLIAINTGVFIYELSLNPYDLQLFIQKYGLLPIDILQLNILNLFTHMFIHGGIGHIIGNMLFLWIFGNNVEDALGKGKFLILYLSSGLAAAFLQSFVSILDGTLNIPMVGASGAISGVLAAYMKLYPYAKVLTFIPPLFFFFFILPAWFFIGYWFLIQILYAIFVPTELGGVAWYAHIGGFIAGWVLINKLYGKNIKLIHYSAIKY